MFLNPLHPTEQRYRHPAGPRYDRVEHRVHNICRYLYAEISPRGLKLLFALIKLPRFLDTSKFTIYHGFRVPYSSQHERVQHSWRIGG
jgi:hypothetical protein